MSPRDINRCARSFRCHCCLCCRLKKQLQLTRKTSCRKNKNARLFADSMSQTDKTRGDYCCPDTYKESQAEAARYFWFVLCFYRFVLRHIGQRTNIISFTVYKSFCKPTYYTFLNNMTLKMLSISQKSSTFAVRKAENVRWCSVYTHT